MTHIKQTARQSIDKNVAKKPLHAKTAQKIMPSLKHLVQAVRCSCCC